MCVRVCARRRHGRRVVRECGVRQRVCSWRANRGENILFPPSKGRRLQDDARVGREVAGRRYDDPLNTLSAHPAHTANTHKIPQTMLRTVAIFGALLMDGIADEEVVV